MVPLPTLMPWRSAIAQELEQARCEHERTGEPARVFADFLYSTRKSWSKWRRVIGKAEHLSKGTNPQNIQDLTRSKQEADMD